MRSAAKPSEPAGNGVRPELRAQIQKSLKSAFKEVAEEPIPQHLLDLLDELGDND